MIEVSTTTAFRERHTQQRIRYAIGRLLDRLQPFVRAYPRDADAELPPHDVVFVTMPDDGPEAQILDALKSCPALWLAALPDDVCIVSRRALVQVPGIEPVVADFLASQGLAIVESHAARHVNDAMSVISPSGA